MRALWQHHGAHGSAARSLCSGMLFNRKRSEELLLEALEEFTLLEYIRRLVTTNFESRYQGRA